MKHKNVLSFNSYQKIQIWDAITYSQKGLKWTALTIPGVSDNEQQLELSHVVVGSSTSTLKNNWVEPIKHTPTHDTEIALLGAYSIGLLTVTEKMFRAALLIMAQTGHSPYVLQ